MARVCTHVQDGQCRRPNSSSTTAVQASSYTWQPPDFWSRGACLQWVYNLIDVVSIFFRMIDTNKRHIGCTQDLKLVQSSISKPAINRYKTMEQPIVRRTKLYMLSLTITQVMREVAKNKFHTIMIISSFSAMTDWQSILKHALDMDTSYVCCAPHAHVGILSYY